MLLMTSSIQSPRTLNGVKHRASLLEKSEGCTRTQALNLASQLAGLSNWNAARRVLPESMPVTCIEARWIDRANGQQGTETLTYPFPRHVGEMFAPRKAGPRLAMFSLVGPDQLMTKEFSSSQAMARGWAVEALRALMFMEATGLKPVNRAGIAYPRKRQTYLGRTYYEAQLIPGQDHISVWYDPKSKGYVIADEPYVHDVDHRRAVERANWCQSNEYQMVKPDWRGMYNPDGGARIHLFTRTSSKIDLADLSQRLEQLPDDFGHEEWKGTSTVREYPSLLLKPLGASGVNA